MSDSTAPVLVGDSLFSEIYILETRQLELTEHYKDATEEEQAQIAGELAEIETALQKHYAFMTDVQDWRSTQRMGVPL